jgi:WD40-like Beta Propeller Repeat
VASDRHGRDPGLREVAVLWGIYLFVAAEVFATYSRLLPHELYHVSRNGRAAGAGRVLVFLNWPVALAAIPMLAVVASAARSRGVSAMAAVAAALCCGVFWPGVVDQADLDVKWSNAVAASGVTLAFVLTIYVLVRRGPGPRTRAPGDRARVATVVLLALVAVPWLGADLGFLVGRWPLLGSIYYSDEWYAPFGDLRAHRAVHAGNHHGLVGVLLVVTVLLLSRTLPELGSRLRRLVGAYLAVLVVYGLGNIVNDFWLEQIVKRGATHWQFPSVIVPTVSVDWLILLVVAAGVYAFLLRRLRAGVPARARRTVWPLLAALPVAALLGVGLAHAGTDHRTPLGFATGIAFAAAPEGTAHIYVTHGRGIVRLTDDHGSDLAPAWSPDHRRLAFQSNRDGNWEVYVMNADGSGVRRLTDDDSEDGEPSWSPNGREILFVRDGRLYSIGVDGRDEHPLRAQRAWGVARSPNGRVLAFQCTLGGHWHICIRSRPSGTIRYLTPHSSDAFAPAWSPDGERIAFISDRDGPDELFVMRADGTHVTRLTSGEAEKDTPTWAGR